MHREMSASQHKKVKNKQSFWIPFKIKNKKNNQEDNQTQLKKTWGEQHLI